MKKFAIIIIILFFIFGGIAVWFKNGLAPASIGSSEQKMFIVRPGAGIKEITKNLKDQNLIKDSVVFFLLVKYRGIDKRIQAGDFRLSPAMTPEQIAESLTHGSLDVWVTIPEGKRAEEIANILKETIPTYSEEWRDALIANEGYLFPDTYLIPKDAGIDNIVSLMRNTFEQKFAEVDNNTDLTKEELVILASMIEREARFEKDRPLISSVMHNRLEIDMPLQIDATVQYAVGYDQGEQTWWKRGLTVNDLKIASPYNTYTNPGLPPGPISNPGLSVLQAAGNPDKTDYLFYITDKTGTNRYAKTNAEHNANIRRYGL